ncbi:arylamine N-acetyltransferase family protein [Dyella japonica]|uniref:N-hydroxyarylamine O-acetyltransferase n=1 Tax=Dyella japonica A8 TaxID=1217721 RepID=A0A075K394_9GAMM|nr:arylamine N-acetyltransferase [Dyella japonica]AIF48520.1 N-hydroxyarylamine O-acetyltransferase [Dyella japonica A8]
MSHRLDLDGYLQRIGFTREPRVDVATLRALATAHIAAIPFENLDPLLRTPVSVDLAAIEHKLVYSQRGGYCFEQNGLFLAVLRAIGFDVSGLIARVLWNKPEDAEVAQTHMLLRVEVEGESWLADVGFGSMALGGALRLVVDEAQPTSLEPFRLITDGTQWRTQALVRDEWRTLYRFRLQDAERIDYVVANHFTSTYPESHFLHSLIVARTLADRRLGLRNREFVVHALGQESVRRTLQTTEEIKRVLEEQFGLRLPVSSLLDATLDALPMPETV